MRNEFKYRQDDWVVFLMGFCVACMLALGCEYSTEVGGPGATVDGKTATDNTFTLTLPAGEVDVEQGESKSITIGIDRGATFTQSVDVSLTTGSDAIVVEPNTLKFVGNADNMDVTVRVKPDATVGVATITLVGQPATGKSVDGMIQVRVNKNAD